MRHDGDNWDIVSSVGRTALGVATFRAVESERPDRLARDDFARMFVEAAGEPHFTEILADPSSLGGKNFLPLMMGPRTKYFDEFFESATAGQARQAVILASGLDARAFRLHWPAGTTVFEIDRTAVLEFKDRVLAEHDAKPTADRRVVVAADLREDWPAALREAGFDPKVPTAWSAEGLLGYLPGTAQDALFERIDAASAPGSQVAAHSAPRDVDFQKMREVIQQYFERNPFGDDQPMDLWYHDTRADPVQWLGEHGWTVEARSIVDLVTGYGRQLPDLSDLPPELVDMGHQMSFWTAVKS